MPMKRSLLLCAALLATCTTAGCNWSKASKETSQKQAEPKELTLVLPDGTGTNKIRSDVFQKAAKQFEEQNAGVKVTIEKLATPKGYTAAVAERLNAVKPVDLVFGGFDVVLADQGAFSDLLPLFKADKRNTDDLVEALVQMATWKGKLVGIPMSPEPLAVYYNKEWFDKAGIPYPKGEWTWEQFLNTSIALKAANTVAGKEVFGSAIPFDLQMFESLAQSSGQSVLSPDGNRTTGYLNSKPVTEAFTLLLTHMNTTRASKAVGNSANAVVSEMTNNTSGMAVGQSIVYASLSNGATTKGKIGIAPLPKLNKGVRANALYFSTLSIASASKQKELAWKFMKDVVLNSGNAFQQDWAQQELLTSKASVQKIGQQLDPGRAILFDELTAAIKPALYRNVKLNGPIDSKVAERLLMSTNEAEVNAALGGMAEYLDQLLRVNP
jgi:ABC-type glycerol-3-phosphate transport system substrate-binding protein